MEESIEAMTQLYSFLLQGKNVVIAVASKSARAAAFLAEAQKNSALTGQIDNYSWLLHLDKRAHLISIPSELTENIIKDLDDFGCAFSIADDKVEEYDYLIIADKDIEKAKNIIETRTKEYEVTMIEKADETNKNFTEAPGETTEKKSAIQSRGSADDKEPIKEQVEKAEARLAAMDVEKAKQIPNPLKELKDTGIEI